LTDLKTLTGAVPAGTVDIVSLVFVLSAIDPSKFESALKNVATILKPGGLLIFRDYGLYDMAMFR
jgi:SAM-dependent methyltransferase